MNDTLAKLITTLPIHEAETVLEHISDRIVIDEEHTGVDNKMFFVNSENSTFNQYVFFMQCDTSKAYYFEF